MRPEVRRAPFPLWTLPAGLLAIGILVWAAPAAATEEPPPAEPGPAAPTTPVPIPPLAGIGNALRKMLSGEGSVD